MLRLVLGWFLVPPPALEEMKTHSWIFYKSSLLTVAEQVWQILQLRPAALFETSKTIPHLNDAHMKVNHVLKSLILKYSGQLIVTFRAQKLINVIQNSSQFQKGNIVKHTA